MFDFSYDDSSKDKGSIKLNLLIAVGIFALIGMIHQEVTGSDVTEALGSGTFSEILSLYM